MASILIPYSDAHSINIQLHRDQVALSILLPFRILPRCTLVRVRSEEENGLARGGFGERGEERDRRETAETVAERRRKNNEEKEKIESEREREGGGEREPGEGRKQRNEKERRKKPRRERKERERERKSAYRQALYIKSTGV